MPTDKQQWKDQLTPRAREILDSHQYPQDKTPSPVYVAVRSMLDEIVDRALNDDSGEGSLDERFAAVNQAVEDMIQAVFDRAESLVFNEGWPGRGISMVDALAAFTSERLTRWHNHDG